MFSGKRKDTRNDKFSSANRTTDDRSWNCQQSTTFPTTIPQWCSYLTGEALILLQNMYIFTSTSPIKYLIHQYINQKMTQGTPSIKGIRFHRIMLTLKSLHQDHISVFHQKKKKDYSALIPIWLNESLRSLSLLGSLFTMQPL